MKLLFGIAMENHTEKPDLLSSMGTATRNGIAMDNYITPNSINQELSKNSHESFFWNPRADVHATSIIFTD